MYKNERARHRAVLQEAANLQETPETSPPTIVSITAVRYLLVLLFYCRASFLDTILNGSFSVA